MQTLKASTVRGGEPTAAAATHAAAPPAQSQVVLCRQRCTCTYPANSYRATVPPAISGWADAAREAQHREHADTQGIDGPWGRTNGRSRNTCGCPTRSVAGGTVKNRLTPTIPPTHIGQQYHLRTAGGPVLREKRSTGNMQTLKVSTVRGENQRPQPQHTRLPHPLSRRWYCAASRPAQ